MPRPPPHSESYRLHTTTTTTTAAAAAVVVSMPDSSNRPDDRAILLRIASPSPLPAAVLTALELSMPIRATVENVKRRIASQLQDALLFATGEPWTTGVYTTDIETVNDELLGDVRGDRVMRIIFQGRFLRDDAVLADVVREVVLPYFIVIFKGLLLTSVLYRARQ